MRTERQKSKFADSPYLPVKIDIQSMTITVPIGIQAEHDPGESAQGKAKLVPLVEHGETVVKLSQGTISKLDYRESELF